MRTLLHPFLELGKVGGKWKVQVPTQIIWVKRISKLPPKECRMKDKALLALREEVAQG